MDALTNTAEMQIRVKNKTGNPGSSFVKTSPGKLGEVFLLVHHQRRKTGDKATVALSPVFLESNRSVGTQFPSQNLLILSPLDLTTPNFRVPLIVSLAGYLISIITGDELETFDSGNVLDGHQHSFSFQLYCSPAVFKTRSGTANFDSFKTEFIGWFYPGMNPDRTGNIHSTLGTMSSTNST
jgi:hypothetical protein